MRSGHRFPLLIHIGYHKTGTTWLQDGLFQDERAGFARPWDSQQIANRLILPNELEFCADRTREEFDAERDRVAQDLTAVLSWERLCGSPHAGGYDSATIAKRLREVFPDGQVLIVVREQRSTVLSLYQQYVRNGGIATLNGYLRPRAAAEIPQFRFEHLEYDRLVECYRALFGSEKVLVLLYEDLGVSPERYSAEISRFCGQDPDTFDGSAVGTVYESLGSATVSLKRYANRWFVRNSLSPGARYYVKNHEERFMRINRYVPSWMNRSVDRRWCSLVDDLVADRYRESNSRLSSIIDRDLAGLGYDTLNSS